MFSNFFCFYGIIAAQKIAIVANKFNYFVEELNYKSEMLNYTVDTVVKFSNYIDFFNILQKETLNREWKLLLVIKILPIELLIN